MSTHVQSRTYTPNGPRECARRMRQFEFIDRWHAVRTVLSRRFKCTDRHARRIVRRNMRAEAAIIAGLS